jgi:hypothetical protein
MGTRLGALARYFGRPRDRVVRNDHHAAVDAAVVGSWLLGSRRRRQGGATQQQCSRVHQRRRSIGLTHTRNGGPTWISRRFV